MGAIKSPNGKRAVLLENFDFSETRVFSVLFTVATTFLLI